MVGTWMAAVPQSSPDDQARQHPYQGLFTDSSSFMKPFCSIHLSLRNLDLQGQGVTEASVPSGRHLHGQGQISEGLQLPWALLLQCMSKGWQSSREAENSGLLGI